MALTITKTHRETISVINQCDIFRDIEFIEYVKEEGDFIEASKIIFPKVIVLTQSCDLQQDYNARIKLKENEKANHDKFLISVIVAPLYNFEDFRQGIHLNQLGLMMENKGQRNKSLCDNILKNENKRYHYLNFANDVELVESVIDFKHFFTVTVNYLESVYKDNYVCSVDILYRELILQRFSYFLARIGLPDT